MHVRTRLLVPVDIPCATAVPAHTADTCVCVCVCVRQVSYAIGVAEPVSITVFHYGTSKLTQRQLLDIVKANFDLRPGRIVQ